MGGSCALVGEMTTTNAMTVCMFDGVCTGPTGTDWSSRVVECLVVACGAWAACGSLLYILRDRADTPVSPRFPELSPDDRAGLEKKASEGNDVNGPVKGNKLIVLELPRSAFPLSGDISPWRVPGVTRLHMWQISCSSGVILVVVIRLCSLHCCHRLISIQKVLALLDI